MLVFIDNSDNPSTFKFKANGGLFEGEGYNIARPKNDYLDSLKVPPFMRYPTSSRLIPQKFNELIRLLEKRFSEKEKYYFKKNQKEISENEKAMFEIESELNEKFDYYLIKNGGMGSPLVEVKNKFPFFNLQYVRSKTDIRKWQKVIDYELAFWGKPERIEKRKKGEKKIFVH
jgi:hypothetical protein